jgi:hypothetical protein
MEDKIEDVEIEDAIYGGLFCKIGRHKFFIFATWT